MPWDYEIERSHIRCYLNPEGRRKVVSSRAAVLRIAVRLLQNVLAETAVSDPFAVSVAKRNSITHARSLTIDCLVNGGADVRRGDVSHLDSRCAGHVSSTAVVAGDAGEGDVLQGSMHRSKSYA